MRAVVPRQQRAKHEELHRIQLHAEEILEDFQDRAEAHAMGDPRGKAEMPNSTRRRRKAIRIGLLLGRDDVWMTLPLILAHGDPTNHVQSALRADFRRTQYVSDLVEPGIRGVPFLYDHGASVPGEHGTMALLPIRRHLDLRN